ncbi:MAG: hypothetical protein RL263_1103 [Bacteroidota bacterium]
MQKEAISHFKGMSKKRNFAFFSYVWKYIRRYR